MAAKPSVLGPNILDQVLVEFEPTLRDIITTYFHTSLTKHPEDAKEKYIDAFNKELAKRYDQEYNSGYDTASIDYCGE